MSDKQTYRCHGSNWHDGTCKHKGYDGCGHPPEWHRPVEKVTKPVT